MKMQQQTASSAAAAQQWQQEAAAQHGGAMVKKDQTEVKYHSAGKEVRLTYGIVRNFLIKGGGNVSDQDIALFINICRFNELNPFLNEAYLIKYGTMPATMIVSKEAFFKRAEENPNYEGIEAGLIIKDKDGKVRELEGAWCDDTDRIMGAWAKVYRKDRRVPITAKVRFSEFDTGKSVWKEKPAIMITKVAKVQALREAFTAQLGSMYTIEETERATQIAEEEQRKSAAATSKASDILNRARAAQQRQTANAAADEAEDARIISETKDNAATDSTPAK